MLNILLIFCFVFDVFPIQTTPDYNCYNHQSPITTSKKLTPVQCDFTPSPLSNIKLAKNALNSVVNNDQAGSLVEVALNCDATSELCDKVKKAFETAATYLQNVIIFKQKIIVNASFYSFCKVNSECITNNLITLGQAGAARSIALKDAEDGKRRLYPQALVKQMELKKQPRYTKTDIIAEFNSDANFWFEGMGDLKGDQSDFLLVISHELIHGLGFSSSYSDYFSEDPVSLTPYPEIFVEEGTGDITFAGFTENIFDKYLLDSLSQKSITSEFADKMNSFSNTTKYSSQLQLENDIINSQVYEYGKELLKLATVEDSLTFTTNNEAVVLETSLKPFTSLSSISHVDYKKYTSTKDFLMRYKTDTGDKLSSLVGKLGEWDTAPYGPHLISMLEKMGYATNKNPNPKVTATQSGCYNTWGSYHVLFLTFTVISLVK